MNTIITISGLVSLRMIISPSNNAREQKKIDALKIKMQAEARRVLEAPLHEVRFHIPLCLENEGENITIDICLEGGHTFEFNRRLIDALCGLVRDDYPAARIECVPRRKDGGLFSS